MLKAKPSKKPKTVEHKPAKQRARISLHSFNTAILILTIFLSLFIVVKIVWHNTLNREQNLSGTTNLTEKEKQKLEESLVNSLWEDVPPEPLSYFALEKEVYAYFIGENQNAAIAVMDAQKDKILTAHPYWYRLKPDMSIEKLKGAEDKKVFEMAENTKIQLYPSFNNAFDSDRLHKMLNNNTLRDRHIEEIIAIMKKYNYDGIDLDYENIKEVDRDEFSEFVRLLAARVHEEKKFLTIALHAKTDDKGKWHGPAATDYAVMNEAADRIMLMTYDYSWGTSPTPGNIAPVSWMREVLDYAVTKIDREKLLLGIHFYGYDWGYDENNRGVLITYKDMLEIRSTYGGSAIQTTSENEKFFTYGRDGRKHTVYFADAETVEARLKLVREYDIAGIGIWRIGDEDERVWERIGKNL